MPLVEPLTEGSSHELDELARFFNETLGFTPNSVRTMQRRPAVARAFINLNKAVMANEGRLSAEQKRLIGLLASSVAECRYCQAHTTLAAQRYGASEERLKDIWDYQTSPLFTRAERAAFNFAVAAASVPNGVNEEVAADVRQHWDDGEIVEILGVVSLFGFLNRWNDSMSTRLEDPATAAAGRTLSDRGWTIGKHV